MRKRECWQVVSVVCCCCCRWARPATGTGCGDLPRLPIIDNTASGFIPHDTLLIRYTQEVVLLEGGVLKKPSAQPTSAADGGAQVRSPSRLPGA